MQDTRRANLTTLMELIESKQEKTNNRIEIHAVVIIARDTTH